MLSFCYEGGKGGAGEGRKGGGRREKRGREKGEKVGGRREKGIGRMEKEGREKGEKGEEKGLPCNPPPSFIKAVHFFRNISRDCWIRGGSNSQIFVKIKFYGILVNL